MDWAANQIPKASAAVARFSQSDATDKQRDAVSPFTVLAAPRKCFLNARCTAGLLTMLAMNAVIASPTHNSRNNSAKTVMAEVPNTVTTIIENTLITAVRLSCNKINI